MRNYPFSAIIGQEKFKTAYLANIVNPDIGGLLVTGVKGTGKSTIVRSVESILPELTVVKECLFNCDPGTREKLCTFCMEKNILETTSKQMKIVNLPLSCSEDRLIGSIEIERLLKEGKKQIQVGVLGEANRNILYIDEVNLLPDHIVDDILDAAALHWNTVEREGFSISHPAEFVLVGSMNPEEGELRPQILDRFPLSVHVNSIMNAELRIEIVKRNIVFSKNPEAFYELFKEEDDVLRQSISNAREILPDVVISPSHLRVISTSCSDLKVDGQRPDIIIVKTSQTIAALDGRKTIREEDIVLSGILTMMHRTRDGGLLEPPREDEIIKTFKRNFKELQSGSFEQPVKFSINSINKKVDNFIQISSEFDDDDTSNPIERKKNKNLT
ncbi:ATP-binding protein [bacterium]|nr:ATP-binding protein [candidate division CSSED10-310 bacterium]